MSRWRDEFLKADIWLLLALSIFAWAPLLAPAYFFNAHDAKHSVFFLVEFDQTWRDGFWWPRWSPDFAFGYGYPLFNLYAPLAFYAAQMLHLLGLGFTTAIKTMYVLATIGAGLGMYTFGQSLFGRRAGLLAAVIYMYTPFHLAEIFVRSAYAEFVALAIIPFLFWAFTALIARPSLQHVALAGFIYGSLALTHHTTFFTFSPLLMLYLLYLILAKTGLRWRVLITHTLFAAAAGLLGLALAAIYLLPVIAETRYIKVEQWTSGSYNYLQHFVYFAQLFSPAWGYGYAGAGLQDDFSFQLGIVAITLICFAALFLLTHTFPQRGVALFFLLATLVIIFLMSPLAGPIWQLIPIATLVQFPWRLLGMTAFTMSIVAGSLLAVSRSHLTHPKQLSIPDSSSQPPQLSHTIPHFSHTIPHLTPPNSQPISTPLLLLALVVMLASFPYTLPQYTEIPAWAETPLAVINWDRASIVDRVGMVSVTQEQPQTSPLEQQYLKGEPLAAASIIAGQGVLETLHRGGASSQVRVIAGEPITLQFYTYDYPGWRVTLDDQPLPHRPEPPFGLITVDLSPGEHIVRLRMGQTPIRVVGTLVSILALIVIVILLFYRLFASKLTILP